MNIFVYLKNEDYKSYFLNKYKDTEYEFLYSLAVLEDTGSMVLFYSDLKQSELEIIYSDFKSIHDKGYQTSNFQVIENILQKVGVSKKVIDEKIISTIKIISEITNNRALIPIHNDVNPLFLGELKDLVTQFSSNLEDTLWLNELQCDIMKKDFVGKKV